MENTPTSIGNPRLTTELKTFSENPVFGISAGPIDNNNLLTWEAIISNSNEDSPFRNGFFKLQIVFTDNYPYSPPKIKMKTKVFHPNIKNEEICLDIIKEDRWSPALTVEKILLSISSLLDDPNPDDPLDVEAANLFKNNLSEYKRKVRNNILKYAKLS